MEMYVRCPECGEEHDSAVVETTNIEEDELGRDVLSFICPVTGKEAKSWVYIRR